MKELLKGKVLLPILQMLLSSERRSHRQSDSNLCQQIANVKHSMTSVIKIGRSFESRNSRDSHIPSFKTYFRMIVNHSVYYCRLYHVRSFHYGAPTFH